MAKKKSLFLQMQNSPTNDWNLADVKKLCRQEGLEIRAPSKGSHYVVSSPHLRDALAVPFKRPIKAVYIKKLVGYVESHIFHRDGEDNE